MYKMDKTNPGGRVKKSPLPRPAGQAESATPDLPAPLTPRELPPPPTQWMSTPLLRFFRPKECPTGSKQYSKTRDKLTIRPLTVEKFKYSFSRFLYAVFLLFLALIDFSP